MELLAAALMLGVAGFDLSGALITITAVSMGLKRKEICTFALTNLIGTVTIGLACSYFLGTNVSHLSDWLNHNSATIRAVFQLVIGCLLLILFAERVFLSKKKDGQFFEKPINEGMLTLGIAFAISALTDPSFISLITLSAYHRQWLAVAAAHCIWIAISQAPSFIITIALLLGKYEAFMAYAQRKTEANPLVKKLKQGAPKVISFVILFVAVFLLWDGIHVLIHETALFS